MSPGKPYYQGRYIFYRNRELTGETAILQSFTYFGRMPYDCRVAIIGNGMTAHGAHRILCGLGAKVDIFTRKLEPLFRERMGDYDVLVNCVLWDTKRTDRLISREDLRRLKRGAMIVDVSCDPHLEIETSHPTTIDNPVYTVDGVLHYAVDNTPAMAYRRSPKSSAIRFHLCRLPRKPRVQYRAGSCRRHPQRSGDESFHSGFSRTPYKRRRTSGGIKTE
jgi:hypothetical protein